MPAPQARKPCGSVGRGCRIAPLDELLGLHRDDAECPHHHEGRSGMPQPTAVPAAGEGAGEMQGDVGERERLVERDRPARLAAGGARLAGAEQQRPADRVALDHRIVHFGVDQARQLLAAPGARRCRRRGRRAVGSARLWVVPRRAWWRGSDPSRRCRCRSATAKCATSRAGRRSPARACLRHGPLPRGRRRRAAPPTSDAGPRRGW